MQLAVPVVITLPLAALYMTYFGGVANNGTHIQESHSANITATPRLNIIGAGGKNRVDNVDGVAAWTGVFEGALNWVKGENRTVDLHETLERIYSNFLDDKFGHVFCLLMHGISFLAFHAIVKHSIVGVLSKMICRHLMELGRRSFRRAVELKSYFTCSIVEFMNASEERDGLNNDDGEEDVFMECTTSSTNFIRRRIETEEVTAKANEADEKHIGDEDKGYESFVRSMRSQLHDSKGSACAAAHKSTSTPRDDPAASSSSSCANQNNSSEKFKRYLHQRSEIVDQVEVTFVEDDDGYIVESGDESLCATRSVSF